MSYYDIEEEPKPTLAQRARRALLSRIPSYASVTFNAAQAAMPHLARERSFFTTSGVRLAPASTHIFAGPFAVKLVWGFDRRRPFTIDTN